MGKEIDPKDKIIQLLTQISIDTDTLLSGKRRKKKGDDVHSSVDKIIDLLEHYTIVPKLVPNNLRVRAALNPVYGQRMIKRQNEQRQAKKKQSRHKPKSRKEDKELVSGFDDPITNEFLNEEELDQIIDDALSLPPHNT